MNKERREALLWWNGLTIIQKENYTEQLFPGMLWYTLTGPDIEKLYKFLNPE